MKGLHEAGMGVRNIARRLERSPNGVSYALRAPEKTKKKGGRPRSLTDRQVREVVRAAATGDYSAAELKATYGLSCSVQHMLARLEFAQRLSTAAQKEVTRQNGGGSLMVWGAFGTKGKSELVVLEGARTLATTSTLCRSICSRLLTSTTEIGVQLLDWPARSPDLNPIENVWAILARKLCGHGMQYNSVPELTAAVMKAWNSAKMNELQDLLDTMPARCFEVARKNGEKTHY
ncbi:Transposable element [Phytophthora megakarya]|uniref:Transposable element n=1 Tax=Phytophthora megakarya TaxID=4795 RepID=A0A225W661_9STRA|nr:Transposable element [Phytophthora megakarya]